MNIDVTISASLIQKKQVEGKLVVVLDVLRASSVICNGLYNGACSFITVDSIEKALKLSSKPKRDWKKEFPQCQNNQQYHNDWALLLHTDKTDERNRKESEIKKNILLGGERNGFKIEGFNLGNSPLEYTSEIVKEKTIILTTTNGTHAIKNSNGAYELIIGSFLNLEKVCEYIHKQKKDVCIVCAGTQNQFSLDDALCAGNIISNLLIKNKKISLTDIAITHKMLYESVSSKNIQEVLKEGCHHYSYLLKNGFSADLDYCLQKNICPVIPKLDGNRIIL